MRVYRRTRHGGVSMSPMTYSAWSLGKVFYGLALIVYVVAGIALLALIAGLWALTAGTADWARRRRKGTPRGWPDCAARELNRIGPKLERFAKTMGPS